MLAELLGAPPVIDDGERRIRLTPVVDVLSVVRNDVSVTRSIGATESTVVELEAVTTSCRTVDDLDFLAVEVSVTKHGTSPLSW